MSAIFPVQLIISIRVASEIGFVDTPAPGSPAGPLNDKSLSPSLIFSIYFRITSNSTVRSFTAIRLCWQSWLIAITNIIA
jgi:hypothetical protein